MADDLHEPTLDPDDDARIRRLLADARHAEPMPDAVAARLDRVLADLSARRAAEVAAPAAEVVDLAARRRRTAGRLLVAAAAVVVAGVGIGQVVGSQQGEDSFSTTDTAAEAPADAQAGGGAAAETQADEDAGAGAEMAAPSAESQRNGEAAGAVVTIRSDHFGQDVRRARNLTASFVASLTAVPTASAEPSPSESDTEGPATDAASAYAAPTCATTAFGAGVALAATYDGAPAVLVLREPAGDVQVVDVYVCDTTEPTRSITLTVPEPGQ